jgi:hypothetical protein
MSVLNLNIDKLSSKETVRYNGPAENREHGTYTIVLMPDPSVMAGTNQVHIHMSLEALIQLKQRIEYAMSHMVSY